MSTAATVRAPEIPAAELATILEAFLAKHPRAAVLEDGRLLFDLRRSRYALSSDHGRCVLQLWSDERNLVRTVTSVQVRKDSLRLQVRRLGTAKPQTLHLLPDRDARTPSTRESARSHYVRLLEHVIPRAFPQWAMEGLSTAIDLEHSFGPAYARGMLTRGRSAWALIGVGPEETGSTVDGVLTLGLLWLDQCRARHEGNRVVEGLKIIVPDGAAELTRSRMSWLHPELAKWELYTLNAATEELSPVELGRDGNLSGRLLRAFRPETALARMRSPLDRIMELLPMGTRTRAEVRPKSASEIAVALHGLEFARVKVAYAPGSFAREDRITFGAGASETPLTGETEAGLRELVARLFESRHPAGDARDPLFRLQPERWMEATLRAALHAIEPALLADPVYSQVPAFAAADRGMLDLLTTTRSGRLAVLELKAEDDLQMPLQGLDYWIRVHGVHRDGRAASHEGGFERAGYFPGQVLAPEAPLLYFVAPALRVHPSTETVLKYVSPEVEWTLLALNEGWRGEPKVVWRKRGGGGREAGPHGQLLIEDAPLRSSARASRERRR